MGGRDGESVDVFRLRAGAFGELSAVEDVVAVVDGLVVVVSVVGLGIPVVADSVVGCSLGFGDGDDVVSVGCGVLGELAFFYGWDGEFVLDFQGLGDVGLVCLSILWFSLWMNTVLRWYGSILRRGKNAYV